jgi:hypothetical protein
MSLKMNTKILMIISALLMAVCGVLFQFIPHQILHLFNADSNGVLPLFVQIMGAMYLGFAMMNWMAKTVLIGGIYARPLAMGNFLHFTIGALALLKFAFSAPNLLVIWVLASIYLIFAILFAVVLFTHPQKAKG